MPHDPEGLPARERNCRAVKHSNGLWIIPIFTDVGQKFGAKFYFRFSSLLNLVVDRLLLTACLYDHSPVKTVRLEPQSSLSTTPSILGCSQALLSALTHCELVYSSIGFSGNTSSDYGCSTAWRHHTNAKYPRPLANPPHHTDPPTPFEPNAIKPFSVLSVSGWQLIGVSLRTGG